MKKCTLILILQIYVQHDEWRYSITVCVYYPTQTEIVNSTLFTYCICVIHALDEAVAGQARSTMKNEKNPAFQHITTSCMVSSIRVSSCVSLISRYRTWHPRVVAATTKVLLLAEATLRCWHQHMRRSSFASPFTLIITVISNIPFDGLGILPFVSNFSPA